MYYNSRDETPKERGLREELERVQEEKREEDDRRYRDDEQRRKERQEEMRERHESWMRSASDWPEALQKQADLCRREFNMMLVDDEKYNTERKPGELEDDYFNQTARANDKALEIWKEVSASKQAELEELQKQIDAVWESVRVEVANQLIAVDSRSEFRQVAQVLRDDALAGYLDW